MLFVSCDKGKDEGKPRLTAPLPLLLRRHPPSQIKCEYVVLSISCDDENEGKFEGKLRLAVSAAYPDIALEKARV